MKAEVRQNCGFGTLYSQEASLVSIDVDHTTTISVAATGVEIETYDEDGNRLTQTWIELADLKKLT